MSRSEYSEPLLREKNGSYGAATSTPADTTTVTISPPSFQECQDTWDAVCTFLEPKDRLPLRQTSRTMSKIASALLVMETLNGEKKFTSINILFYYLVKNVFTGNKPVNFGFPIGIRNGEDGELQALCQKLSSLIRPIIDAAEQGTVIPSSLSNAYAQLQKDLSQSISHPAPNNVACIAKHLLRGDVATLEERRKNELRATKKFAWLTLVSFLVLAISAYGIINYLIHVISGCGSNNLPQNSTTTSPLGCSSQPSLVGAGIELGIPGTLISMLAVLGFGGRFNYHRQNCFSSPRSIPTSVYAMFQKVMEETGQQATNATTSCAAPVIPPYNSPGHK